MEKAKKNINPEQITGLAKAIEVIGLAIWGLINLFKRKKKDPGTGANTSDDQ